MHLSRQQASGRRPATECDRRAHRRKSSRRHRNSTVPIRKGARRIAITRNIAPSGSRSVDAIHCVWSWPIVHCTSSSSMSISTRRLRKACSISEMRIVQVLPYHEELLRGEHIVHDNGINVIVLEQLYDANVTTMEAQPIYWQGKRSYSFGSRGTSVRKTLSLRLCVQLREERPVRVVVNL